MTRPRGEVGLALLSAAASSPGTVRELAARSSVGYATARYTVSRLVDRAELVAVCDGRPAIFRLCAARPAGQATEPSQALAALDALAALTQRWWVDSLAPTEGGVHDPSAG